MLLSCDSQIRTKELLALINLFLTRVDCSSQRKYVVCGSSPSFQHLLWGDSRVIDCFHPRGATEELYYL